MGVGPSEQLHSRMLNEIAPKLGPMLKMIMIETTLDRVLTRILKIGVPKTFLGKSRSPTFVQCKIEEIP